MPVPPACLPAPPGLPVCSSESESGSSEYSGSDDEEDGEGSDPNAQTAWEVGLNGAALVDDEAGLLPPGASEATYVRVSGTCQMGHV
jgi:hypothetical protein